MLILGITLGNVLLFTAWLADLQFILKFVVFVFGLYCVVRGVGILGDQERYKALAEIGSSSMSKPMSLYRSPLLVASKSAFVFVLFSTACFPFLFFDSGGAELSGNPDYEWTGRVLDTTITTPSLVFGETYLQCMLTLIVFVGALEYLRARHENRANGHTSVPNENRYGLICMAGSFLIGLLVILVSSHLLISFSSIQDVPQGFISGRTGTGKTGAFGFLGFVLFILSIPFAISLAQKIIARPLIRLFHGPLEGFSTIGVLMSVPAGIIIAIAPPPIFG